MVITEESLYRLDINDTQNIWDTILSSITKFLERKAKQNHVEIDYKILTTYAVEIFTYYRETNEIFTGGYDTDNLQPFFDKFESEVFKLGWVPKALLVMKLLFRDKLEGE